MEIHRYTPTGEIDATIDGVRLTVPDDLGNRHRQMIAEWEMAGNSIPPYAPPEASVEEYEAAVQTHVDEVANSRLFRDGVTLASYTMSTNPQWAAEARAFVAWRDQVWAYSYQELARVQSGEREQPTVLEILAELPPIVWP